MRTGRMVCTAVWRPVMPAVADWMRVWDMWATADWDDSVALSDKAIRSVQRDYDRGEPLAVRAWGHCNCARQSRRRGAVVRPKRRIGSSMHGARPSGWLRPPALRSTTATV